MPCLAHEYHPKLPATNHCKSLSCLVRETYAHCHVPCAGRMRGAGWSSGDDSDDEEIGDALDTKQVILNEMRNRQLKRKESRCSVESPTLSSTFVWSFTQLEPSPRSVLEKVSSIEKDEKDKEAASDDGRGDADDVESEAFFSVKSFFTRSTSRAATVASSADLDPAATWEGFRDCEGWPFGLCRRPAVPPLPSTPADSWKWRKQSSMGNLLAASPARAYSCKVATSLPASPLARKNLDDVNRPS